MEALRRKYRPSTTKVTIADLDQPYIINANAREEYHDQREMESQESQEEVIDNPSPEPEEIPEPQNDPSSSYPGVHVSGAYKKVGKSLQVLQNLNMTVDQGSIYTLLGASGCGKTTLLQAIVGVKSLDKGEIRLFGYKPRSKESGIPGKGVGFMPQEIALFGEFTIGEAIHFFGRIYGMSQSHIMKRKEFILKLLDLPPESRIVRSLSGGQKRRVSFSLALLHESRLLILDEPTVGIDPLLRQTIWAYLRQLSITKRTTVIITTHNIEEANQADTVGLMRNGRLLTERSPQMLIEKHGCSLEEVVLRLCLRDQSTSTSFLNQGLDPIDPIDTSTTEETSLVRLRKLSTRIVVSVTPKKSGFNLLAFSEFSNRLRALLIRNFIRMWRNIGFVIFLSIFPSLGLILFCLAIGGELQSINFGFVNKEQDFGVCFNGRRGLKECNLETNLSCKFFDAIPHNYINLIEYHNESEAIADVLEGNIWGYILFPRVFQWLNIFTPIATSGQPTEETKVNIRLDSTNQQVALNIQKIIAQSLEAFTKGLFAACAEPQQSGSPPDVTLAPIKFGKPFYGDKEASFTEYIAPSLFIAQILFMSISLTGQVLIDEKQQGMMERAIVAGVTRQEIIISHLIPQYLIMLLQFLTSLLILNLSLLNLVVWFDMPIRGPIFGVILLSCLQGTIGIGIGFLISTLCDKESTVMQLTLGMVTPNFILSGTLWPLESMPSWMKILAYTLPATFAGESMRSMLSRGWGIAHQKVLPGFLVSGAWIYFLLFLVFFINRAENF